MSITKSDGVTSAVPGTPTTYTIVVSNAGQVHPGTIVEISDISGTKGRTFAHIRKVAQNWDGSDPIRTFG